MNEKKPNAKAEIAEKPIAKIFFNLIWRKNDTTDKIVTNNRIIPSTMKYTPLLSITLFIAIGYIFYYYVID